MVFPYCSNCTKEVGKSFLMLVEISGQGEAGVGYHCDEVCLKQWLDKHR